MPGLNLLAVSCLVHDILCNRVSRRIKLLGAGMLIISWFICTFVRSSIFILEQCRALDGTAGLHKSSKSIFMHVWAYPLWDFHMLPIQRTSKIESG